MVDAVLNAQRVDSSAVLTTTGAVRAESVKDTLYRTKSNGTDVRNRRNGADPNTWNTGTSYAYLSGSDWWVPSRRAWRI